MTRPTLTRWLVLGLPAFILVSMPYMTLAEPERQTVHGQTSAYPVSDRQNALAAGQPAPVYRPPHRLAPLHGLRVGGGTRALTGTVPAIVTLVPDHRGLTSSSQPTLYWYTAGSITTPVEFTLVLEQTGDTIAEFHLPLPIGAGIHAIRLGEYGIELKEGRAYVWSVALVMDSNRRSKDILAVGSIERTTPQDFASTGLPAVESATYFAHAGLWYDALDVISVAIAKRPGDLALHDLRDTLLRGVGLMSIIGLLNETTTPAIRHPF